MGGIAAIDRIIVQNAAQIEDFDKVSAMSWG